MGKAMPGDGQGRHTQEPHHRRGGSSTKARQPRVLHEALELLCRRRGQEPGHQEHPDSSGNGSAQACGAVADKGGGNQHRAWRHVPTGHGRGEILGAHPTRLTHGQTLDERQCRRSPTEGQEANEDKTREQLEDYGRPSFPCWS